MYHDVVSAPCFDPHAPTWIHKSNFLCAYTFAELLGSFRTTYEDRSERITVFDRQGGSQLFSESFADPSGRLKIADFFSKTCGRRLKLMEGLDSTHHHFGNTPAGFKASGDSRVIHIVNLDTVSMLSTAANVPLHASRFRPNLVVEGIPPWEEFSWVGKMVKIGGVTLRILGRTVRCEATNYDARNGSGKEDYNVPGLLTKHFPQHGPYLGVYAQVVKGGTLTAGDDVILLPPPPKYPQFFLNTACIALLVIALSRIS
jgi:hypothetical protein